MTFMTICDIIRVWAAVRTARMELWQIILEERGCFMISFINKLLGRSPDFGIGCLFESMALSTAIAAFLIFQSDTSKITSEELKALYIASAVVAFFGIWLFFLFRKDGKDSRRESENPVADIFIASSIGLFGLLLGVAEYFFTICIF